MSKNDKAEDQKPSAPTGIMDLEPPTARRGSRYDFDGEQIQAAIDLLNDGGNPGAAGYDKPSSARLAGNRLIDATSLPNVGCRVWETEDGRWAFSLKWGRKKKNSPMQG